MAKYIDIEKLKAEIEKLGEIDYPYSYEQCVGFYDALDRIESFIDSLQKEQPEEICSKCIHHGKDDDYCYNPHGGMQYWINENGVYKCTGFYEKEQEQNEVDLEKFTEKMDAWKARYNYPDNILVKGAMAFTARMFYMYPNVAREWYDSLPKVTLD